MKQVKSWLYPTIFFVCTPTAFIWWIYDPKATILPLILVVVGFAAYIVDGIVNGKNTPLGY